MGKDEKQVQGFNCDQMFETGIMITAAELC
jgi:hypothetical protein